MEDIYYNFEALTVFITKDDIRGSAIEAALKRDKDEGDGGKKVAKKKERKWNSSWLRYLIWNFVNKNSNFIDNRKSLILINHKQINFKYFIKLIRCKNLLKLEITNFLFYLYK